MISTHHLSIALARRRIIHPLDLTLHPGELVGLIGANGSGKSTLLRALCGLLPPEHGTVSLHGRPLASLPPREVARQVAYLPQSAVCHWPLEAERVVALGRLPHHGGGAEVDAAEIARALAAVDALHLRHRIVTELSGGERARVFLARALAGNPRYLFVDEPTAGLDPYHQLQLMELLRGLAHGGKADETSVPTGCGVLAVLHDLTLAARFCDRLLALHEGRLIADGPPQEVLSDALLARSHSIRVLRHRHGGETVLVPWEREERAAAGAPSASAETALPDPTLDKSSA